jgi:hypothetical protein
MLFVLVGNFFFFLKKFIGRDIVSRVMGCASLVWSVDTRLEPIKTKKREKLLIKESHETQTTPSHQRLPQMIAHMRMYCVSFDLFFG